MDLSHRFATCDAEHKMEGRLFTSEKPYIDYRYWNCITNSGIPSIIITALGDIQLETSLAE